MYHPSKNIEMKRSLEVVHHGPPVFPLMYIPPEIMALILNPLDTKGYFHWLFGLLCINKESYVRFPLHIASFYIYRRIFPVDLDFNSRHNGVPFTAIRRCMKECVTHLTIKQQAQLDLTGFSKLFHLSLTRDSIDVEMMRKLPSLISLDISGLNHSNRGKYNQLHTLTNLKCLRMSCNFAGIGDECLCRMTSLTSLDISCIRGPFTGITRKGIEPLVNLTSLDIHGNDMLIQGAFTRFTSLHTLRIDWGKYSPANSHEIHLIPSLTRLTVLPCGTDTMRHVHHYVTKYPSMKNVKVVFG